MPPEPNTPRQQSIPGIEPDHPEVAFRIEQWLEAKAVLEHAAEILKAADDAVLMTMMAQGVPHYPYTDPKSGKRKFRIVDTTPRSKSVSARPDAAPDQADEPTMNDDSASTETPPAAPNNEITHRRVPRVMVENELAAIAEETRRRDAADDPMAQASTAIDGALRPARNWEDEDDADAAPDQADEESREPTRYDLLEPYENPSAVVAPVDSEEDGPDTKGKPKTERFDAELLATGKCALRFEGGPACDLDVGHAGLHRSPDHKWKARRGKPDVAVPSILDQAALAQDAASETAR